MVLSAKRGVSACMYFLVEYEDMMIARLYAIKTVGNHLINVLIKLIINQIIQVGSTVKSNIKKFRKSLLYSFQFPCKTALENDLCTLVWRIKH